MVVVPICYATNEHSTDGGGDPTKYISMASCMFHYTENLGSNTDKKKSHAVSPILPFNLPSLCCVRCSDQSYSLY